MVWNPEKYREKREKVLGIRRRGISFGIMAGMVSAAILVGFALVYVPGAISYVQTRHLDDAIYKLTTGQAWPVPMVEEIQQLSGVTAAQRDTHGTRLVVTFDRRYTGPAAFVSWFKKKNLDAALLNQVGHRQRQTTLEKEAHHETL